MGTDLSKDYFVSVNRCRFSYIISNVNLADDISIRVVGRDDPFNPKEVVTAKRIVTAQFCKVYPWMFWITEGEPYYIYIKVSTGYALDLDILVRYVTAQRLKFCQRIMLRLE